MLADRQNFRQRPECVRNLPCGARSHNELARLPYKISEADILQHLHPVGALRDSMQGSHSIDDRELCDVPLIDLQNSRST